MKQRIVTGVLAAALFLPIVFYGGLPFVLLTYFLATVGLYELLKMKKLSIFSVHGLLSVLFLWVILFPKQYDQVLNTFYYKNRAWNCFYPFIIGIHSGNKKSFYL
jgi:phosphatidate cytidylyltransferase